MRQTKKWEYYFSSCIYIALMIFFIVQCSGCNIDRVYKTEFIDCSYDTNENRAKFALECIKNANPKSDEEPEDWIYICQKMADQLYCKKQRGFYHRVGDSASGLRNTHPEPCSQADTLEEKEICR